MTHTTYNSTLPRLAYYEDGTSPEQIFQDEVAMQLRAKFGFKAKKDDKISLIEHLWSNLKRMQ